MWSIAVSIPLLPIARLYHRSQLSPLSRAVGSVPLYTFLSDPIDSEIPTDLSSKNVVDFPVARNGRTPITSIVLPPRVSSSFTD